MYDAGFYTASHPWYFETLGRLATTSEYADLLFSLVPDSWKISRSDVWMHVAPPATMVKKQGFKIHLSSRLDSGEEMLRRFVPVCVAQGLEFKIAADPTLHSYINSKRYHRGGSGKFATIYPPDSSSFMQAAKALHEATEGLEGPYILSDKRYPGSKVVFYRYGAFQRIQELRHDGGKRMMMYSPEGRLLPDERLPYFALPPWVSDPFPDAVGRSEESDLLHDRYQVEKALAFTNTGGVYKAMDTHSGATVVIKEARPHTLMLGANRVVMEAVAALENEFKILRCLQGLPYVPRVIDYYEEWEHTFLAESYFEGIPAASFRAMDGFMMMDKIENPQELAESCWIWRKIALQLLEGVEEIHGRGVIIGDISPGNVLIHPKTHQIGFVDFEGSLATGADLEIKRLGRHWFNPGFRRPEMHKGGELAKEDDFYCCAMLLYNLVCPVQTLFELDKSHSVFRILDYFTEMGLPAEIRYVIQALAMGKADEAKGVLSHWRPETVQKVS